MHQKTLHEEIPSTKEGINIYITELQKELDHWKPYVKRLELGLKKAKERRDTWK